MKNRKVLKFVSFFCLLLILLVFLCGIWAVFCSFDAISDTVSFYFYSFFLFVDGLLLSVLLRDVPFFVKHLFEPQDSIPSART